MDYYILITDAKYEDRGLLAKFTVSNCVYTCSLLFKKENRITVLWYIMLLNIK